jgi:hypothetical protein
MVPDNILSKKVPHVDCFE